MYRKKKEKFENDIINQASAVVANEMAGNVQAGTEKAISGMELFKWKAGRVANVGFEQSKGNLFEYIEVAKLERNMANTGAQAFDRNPLTDASGVMGGFGENTAPDDFRLQKNQKIIGRGQAKYNNESHKAALNFTNDKYIQMQRIAPSDQVIDIKKQLDTMLAKGEISQKAYTDACNNLQYKGLSDPDSGISSGGTTSEEIKSLMGKDGKVSQDAVKKYANRFETRQYIQEIGTTVAYGAEAAAITTGLVSGVQNMYAVLNGRKKLDEALKDIGINTVKGASRGGTTGLISSLLHITGVKAKVPLISDSSVATVIAGSIVDGGAAIFAYGKGEISSEQLKEELQNTTVKATTTIYFTKAITTVVGSVNPFITMSIYSVASYVVICTREIINNAKLNAAEYIRIANLLDESTKLMEDFHVQMNGYLQYYEQKQRQVMQQFLCDFEYNLESGRSYDQAIYTIIKFANQTGFALQHANFSDFSSAMISDQEFVLK
jgi:hypothetical protein